MRAMVLHTEVVGCEALREATRGCRLLLLAATDVEAQPMRAALIDPIQMQFVTKKVSIGELRAEHAVEGIRVALAVSGCDKVNAALTLASLLQAMSPAPELVLQVGIAGALPAAAGGPGARPGDLVVATQEAYSDSGSSSPGGWIPVKDLGLSIAEVDGRESGGVFPLDAALVGWALAALNGADIRAPGCAAETPAVLAGPCITSSTVTGTGEEAKRIAEQWGALAESMEGAAAAHVCALYGVPFLELRGVSNLVGDRDRARWVVDQAAQTAGRAALVLAAAMAGKVGT